MHYFTNFNKKKISIENFWRHLNFYQRKKNAIEEDVSCVYIYIEVTEYLVKIYLQRSKLN